LIGNIAVIRCASCGCDAIFCAIGETGAVGRVPVVVPVVVVVPVEDAAVDVPLAGVDLLVVVVACVEGVDGPCVTVAWL
jgi:hypothetical protein